MTQIFNDIPSTALVGSSLDDIKNRDQAAKTNFMGTALPTVTADDVGMSVVIIKTENDILTRQVWRLVGFTGNNADWVIERDLNKGLVYSNTSSDKEITDYQPLNTLLTSLSGQTAGSGQSNANKFPYLSANNTFSLAPITATARNLLAAADAAAARSVLGLGSLATKNSVAAADIGNVLTISNLANATPNTIIKYNASGVPTLVSMPSGIPVGSIMIWTSTVLPDNSWIFCYGQQLSKSTYSELWSYASGSNNIVSDFSDWQTNRKGSFYDENTTTFRVPDLRNYFIRAWNGPTGSSRTIGTNQTSLVGSHTHNLKVNNNNYGASGGKTFASNNYLGSGTSNSKSRFNAETSSNLENTTIVAPNTSSDDTRPMNIALPFIMKAKSLPT